MSLHFSRFQLQVIEKGPPISGFGMKNAIRKLPFFTLTDEWCSPICGDGEKVHANDTYYNPLVS